MPAHLTLFRTLPPSAESEVRRSLSRAAQDDAPKASAAGIMDLDSGAAIRIDSPGLNAIREQLADEFHGLLAAHDLGPWTPHVTIQNKVPPRTARALVRQLREGFEPQPLVICGIELIRYVEGEWEPLASWRFRSAVTR